MTSVLLIYPYFHPSHDRSIFRFPPLGIGYVASSLRKAGHDVNLLDCTFMDRQEALGRAINTRAKIVGIYSMATMYRESLWFARHLRGKCDLLIAGGPLPTCEPASFLDDFDIVVIGEGEHTMTEILHVYEHEESFASVSGIAYQRGFSNLREGHNSEIIFTASRPLEPHLDSLSLPARDLLPNRDYIDFWRQRDGYAATSVMTSRGCPFNCEFCSNKVFGVSYRERSPGNVIDEVEQALSLGYNWIHFADDVFTLKQERIARICEEIVARKLKFGWECLARVDSIDRQIAGTMKEAGCVRIFFGIESGTDSILKLMNKRITVEKARHAVLATHEAGLKTGAFFILCYPGETDATVLNTLRFATSLPLDYLSFTMPYPLPGTDLYERVKHSIEKEWVARTGLLNEHSLIFRSEFSEAKMKYAILKGEIQFRVKKKLGRAAPLAVKPFEILTDSIFRIIK